MSLLLATTLATGLIRLFGPLAKRALAVLGTSPRWEPGKSANVLARETAPAAMVPSALAWKSVICCAVGRASRKKLAGFRLNLRADGELC